MAAPDPAPREDGATLQGFSEAMKQSLSFSAELTLYLVHGWLHLAGYKDEKHKDRMEMKAKEVIIMKSLKDESMIPSFKISNQ